MFEKDIYLIALEILIENIVNHQKQRETLPKLEEVCKFLDNFFNTGHFFDLLSNKIKFYNEVLIHDDESLFISDTHVPYLVKTEKLVSSFEKMNVVLIIKSWIIEYHFPNKLIYNKIGLHLGLDVDMLEQINSFWENNSEIQKIENYLILTPEEELSHESLEGEWVESNKHLVEESKNQLSSSSIRHQIHALYLDSYNSFILKCTQKPQPRILKNEYLCPDNFCIIQFGDTLSIDNDTKVSFADLKKKFVERRYHNKFQLSAYHAELPITLQRSLKAFNFIGLPGELIGIMGNEGAGKSTLLKILSGVEKIKSGQVMINGYDIYKYRYQLSGFIGYVPEEDLLYYNLTVKENLEIAAQLYINKIRHKDTESLVSNLLSEMELKDIKDTIVGKPSLKNIQPGQRRLLNIALELIRDPQILIIDNAVSSLSLNDSTKVIRILAKYTFKGKLIVTTITQTSNTTFELFDNLFILSDEGYPVYSGARHKALSFFLDLLPDGVKRGIRKNESFEPELILDLLNSSKSETRSNKYQNKYIHAVELYKKFELETSDKVKSLRKKLKIPGTNALPARLEKQYIIYTYRNFKTKLAKKKELVFTILTAPLIGLITALLLRTSEGPQYYFGQNPNLPIFIFLSLIINFFNGIAQASLEIFKEKHVLKKEEYLHLSLFSYINSKITLLLMIILAQTFLYTYLTNTVFEKKGMLFYDWTIYFSCSITGALIGLLFSSTQKDINTILLKSVPITLLLYLVLGGGWISFKDISFTKDKYTPFLSDLVVTKWGYEALMVEQFSKNYYQRIFFDVEKEISTGTYHSFHSIPKMKEWMEFIRERADSSNTDSVISLKTIISNQLKFYQQTEDIYPFEYADSFIDSDNEDIMNETSDYLSYLDYFFYKKYNDGLKRKNLLTDSLKALIGDTGLEKLKLEHYNTFVAQKVKNTSTRESMKIIDDDLVQLSDPIFQNARSNFGRAPMFLPEKRFNNQIIKTFEFDLSMIWLFNFIFYIFLITDLFNKSITIFSKKQG